MIALLDYGAGNLRSVEKALLHVGAKIKLVRSKDELGDARAMVLPGVGAFDDCIHALRKQELLEVAKEFIRGGRPFLGICVGYQALFDRSDEFNSCAQGMSVFSGDVVRFPSLPGLKIPQIGWNKIQITQKECPIFRGVPDGSYVYFVHSYHPNPVDSSIVAATTQYGRTFSSVVWRKNVVATQFHPEKSQVVGLRMLQNFVEWQETLC